MFSYISVKTAKRNFFFKELDNFKDNIASIVSGDFNNHNTNWGHEKTNDDGAKVEDRAEVKCLKYIFNATFDFIFTMVDESKAASW